MTSGVFHMVPLDEIIVKRDERQRTELTEIDVLADSIRRLGLIHPLVITRQGELISGERRYTAIKSLGWMTVPIQYVDEVEPARLREIELEENIKRQDITWQDRAMAVHEYHKLRKAEEPGWVYADTAKSLGINRQHVNSLVDVANEMISGNKMVIEAPSWPTAKGIVVRANERRAEQVLEKLREDHFEGVTIEPETIAPENILIENFNDWVLDYEGPKFNFIHCDFPYGIDADSFNQGGAASHGGYADTVETWERLMESLEAASRNVISMSAHLMFWFAMRKGDKRLYEPTARRLESFGWDINPMPLVWIKSDGSGIIPDPQRGPRQIYETCLLGSRGDRKIVRAVANAYAAPTVRERHMSEKPEPMLRHFFGMLVDQNTVMLDPTCGSGSALRAAESLGAKHVLGLEVNPDFAALARDALKKFRTLRQATEGQ